MLSFHSASVLYRAILRVYATPISVMGFVMGFS